MEPDAVGPVGPAARGADVRAGTDLPGVGLLAADSIFVALLSRALRDEGVDLAPDPTRHPVLVVPPSSTIELHRGVWSSRLDAVPLDVPMVVLAVPALPVQHLVADRLHLGRASILDATTATVSTVISMLRLALDGRQVIDPPFAAEATAHLAATLSEAEREVLELMVAGLSNHAIAEHRFVAERTVETHVRQIFRKLGLVDGNDVNRRVLATRLVLTGNVALPSLPSGSGRRNVERG
ncbi:MAG: LuxR C-terminal-related transcriptional regulator [Acidimicrobiia bacterium]